MRGLTFREFSELPSNEQHKILEHFIDSLDEKFLKGVIIKGHTNELHVGQSEEELLSRTMRDNKSASTFNTPSELTWNIKENLFYLVPKITEWLTGYDGRMSNSEFRQKTFDINIFEKDEYGPQYCQGLTTDLELRETNVAKLVLARNLDLYSQDGMFFFYVKTVYPDINHEQSRSLNRNLREEAKDFFDNGILVDGVRKRLPELKKGYWAFKLAGCKPFTITNFDNDKVVVPYNINGIKFSATFTSGSEGYFAPIMSVNIGQDKPQYVPLKKANIDKATSDLAYDFGVELMKIYKNVTQNKSINEILASASLKRFENVVNYQLHSADYKEAKKEIKTSNTKDYITI